jgi:mono/diheme cytochrome c family protein
MRRIASAATKLPGFVKRAQHALARAKYRRSRIALGACVLGGLALASSAALALPWDVDMVDQVNIKAYERKMEPLPDGVVAQPNILSPKSYVMVDGQLALRDQNHKPTDPEAATITSPFPADAASLATGQKMYGIYCTPCHGDGITLGALSQPGRVPAIPQLAGPDGRLHRLTDGWVYYTIRNGSVSQIMPPYGYTMTETEQWSLVQYLRTLDNGQYVPPEPTPAPAPEIK